MKKAQYENSKKYVPNMNNFRKSLKKYSKSLPFNLF